MVKALTLTMEVLISGIVLMDVLNICFLTLRPDQEVVAADVQRMGVPLIAQHAVSMEPVIAQASRS